MNLAGTITEAEFEVMKILWRENAPVSSVDIRQELQKTKGWGKSTILTLIRRLTEKQVITQQRHEVFFYTPNITEAEYSQSEMQKMIDKLYSGSTKDFIATLCNGSNLSDDDIDELKAYFRMEGK